MKSNTRSSITIPERSWARFRDVFADFVDKMSDSIQSGGETNKATGNGPAK